MELRAGQVELQAKFLPFDARRMIGVIARRLNIRRPVWLDNTDLLGIADDAGYLADAVPENELESFFAVDLALRAVGKAARDTQYVVIECSNTVDRNDILRIRRNADLLARFTGCHTHAMVIGNRLPGAYCVRGRGQRGALAAARRPGDPRYLNRPGRAGNVALVARAAFLFRWFGWLTFAPHKLDSGLRRNDDDISRTKTAAKALDSGLRRNDGQFDNAP